MRIPSNLGLLVGLLAPALPAVGAEPPPPPLRRGPLEWREPWLLAQPLLLLAAAAPDVLSPGDRSLRLEMEMGNDFGWSQDRIGESPMERRFLVDGEHRTLALELRAGLGAGLEAGVRLPLLWRGGGFLDGVIDWFHGLTGLPGGGREFFFEDQLRVEGRLESGRLLLWSGGTGTGMGDVELALKRRLAGGPGAGWSAAVAARASLPTGSDGFGGEGVAVGGQLLVARRLGSSADVYVGAGATHWGRGERDGLDYARDRAHGFVALEWRPFRRWSLLAQVDATSRLVRHLRAYPGRQGYLRIGARWQIGDRWILEGGFTEGLVDQHITTDFGVGVGLVRSF